MITTKLVSMLLLPSVSVWDMLTAAAFSYVLLAHGLWSALAVGFGLWAIGRILRKLFASKMFVLAVDSLSAKMDRIDRAGKL